MSELTQLEMTLEEARETDRLIKRHINTTRYLLLDMRDRKGWKAMGYESFKTYGEKELGYQEAHIYRLVEAAEVSIQIGYSPIGESKQPSESQLRPLKAVPEEARKAIWDEATRKAEEENAKLTAKRVEDAVAEWKQRSEEWREQALTAAKKSQTMELQYAATANELHNLKTVSPKIPADYETTRKQAAAMAKELDALKKKQADLVQQQVTAKLREREKEIADMDRKIKDSEAHLSSLRHQIDGYSSIERMTRLQRSQIEKTRSMLVELAANMEGFTPLENDPETDRLWDALMGMLSNGAAAVAYFRGHSQRALTGELLESA